MADADVMRRKGGTPAAQPPDPFIMTRHSALFVTRGGIEPPTERAVRYSGFLTALPLSYRVMFSAVRRHDVGGVVCIIIFNTVALGVSRLWGNYTNESLNHT